MEDMEDDGPWYLGKAREEYKRKRGQDASKPREDEDPVQVSYRKAPSSALSCSEGNVYCSGQETDATLSKSEIVISDLRITLKVLCEVETAAMSRSTSLRRR